MSPSRAEFPNDDDGEVLFRLATKGVDLSRKREIEFYSYARDKDLAERIADDLVSYGYRSTVFVDGGRDGSGSGSGSVSVYSVITMLPKYELIVLEQKRLNLVLESYGAHCDGWMTES